MFDGELLCVCVYNEVLFKQKLQQFVQSISDIVSISDVQYIFPMSNILVLAPSPSPWPSHSP